MEIYGNVEQISLNQTILEAWLFFLTSYVSALQFRRLGIEDAKNRKNHNSLIVRVRDICCTFP